MPSVSANTQAEQGMASSGSSVMTPLNFGAMFGRTKSKHAPSQQADVDSKERRSGGSGTCKRESAHVGMIPMSDLLLLFVCLLICLFSV